ncbi:MAG: tryptophan-rich sensory protein, partial [Anaerolineae bacterium]|nr:tryptophan-rich sensory protein [Anaerolineae bacterium]
IFTAPAIPTWYATLEKPSFTPPSWLFAPAWITLFVLMGVAAFLVWRRRLEERQVKIALGIFIVQLILNALW